MRHAVRHGGAFVRLLIGVAAALAVGTFTAFGAGGDHGTGCAAAPAAGKRAAAPAPLPPVAGVAAALRAGIDPATGRLREPTREEGEALARAAAQALAASAPPVVVRHADGMLSVELGDAFMNDVVARRNPDGSISMVCVPGSQTEKAMTLPAPVKGPGFEKE